MDAWFVNADERGSKTGARQLQNYFQERKIKKECLLHRSNADAKKRGLMRKEKILQKKKMLAAT